MNNLISNQIALSDAVLKAWDRVVSLQKQGRTAESTGPNSIAELRRNLYPIREALRESLGNSIGTIPEYAHLKTYLSHFWQMSQKGALFKEYIWNFVAPDRDLTRGRLQVTFCPSQTVRCEYVAYKVTKSNRSFHIDNLARWLKNPSWFKKFRRGCENLPTGFKLECVCENDLEISNYISKITDREWGALHTNGLKTRNYFVISYDRPRDLLRHLTVPEFAELIANDFSALSGLYPFLQGEKKAPDPSQQNAKSAIVKGAVRKSIPPISMGFNPEFSDKRTEYKIENSIISRRRHGLVVNTLSEILAKEGFKVANNQYLDIFVLNSRNKITHLFEAKTDTGTSSMYSAVGQLMLHGAAQDSSPQCFIVIPEKPAPATADALGRLGIKILTYRMVDDKVVFSSLGNSVMGQNRICSY